MTSWPTHTMAPPLPLIGPFVSDPPSEIMKCWNKILTHAETVSLVVLFESTAYISVRQLVAWQQQDRQTGNRSKWQAIYSGEHKLGQQTVDNKVYVVMSLVCLWSSSVNMGSTHISWWSHLVWRTVALQEHHHHTFIFTGMWDWRFPDLLSLKKADN